MLQNLLKQKNPYYSNLSESGQKKFEQRVFEFIQTKNFVGRQDLVITDEIRILISAAAVQLTFGLNNFLITNLHTINVFPRIFFSKMYNLSFKGLTTRDGIISLSWEDFKQGYANSTDKLNLGLHELAHALNIDLDERKKHDTHFSTQLKNWKKLAIIDFQKLKAGKNPFLRSYGSTNLYEFFAVCIEHFFELPEEFKKKLPNLYRQTALLLNQDPTNVTEDYLIKKGSPFFRPSEEEIGLLTDGKHNPSESPDLIPDTKFQHLIRKKGVYAAMAITVFGFIGIPILFWFSSVTVISVGTLLILLFGCGVLGLLQWNYVKEHIDMAYHQFTMYAFVGFGVSLMNIILLLNYSVTISSYTKTYGLSRKGFYNQITLKGEKRNSPLERVINNYNEHPEDALLSKEVSIRFDKGLLGFDIVRECIFE